MNTDLVDKALNVLLRSDTQGFGFALNRASFPKGTQITIESLREWLCAMDEWTLQLFIEDIESNLYDGEPAQIYVVNHRISVVKPILVTGKVDRNTETYIHPVLVRSEIIPAQLIATFITRLLCGNKGVEAAITMLENKEKVITLMRNAFFEGGSLPAEVKAAIDRLCDDTVDSEGVRQVSHCIRSLTSLVNAPLLYWTPVHMSNGDLNFEFTLALPVQ